MVKINRFKETFQCVNAFGQTDKGMMRLAYGAAEQQATHYFMQCCRQAGLSVTMDAAGNVRARRPGTIAGLPAVGIGSHLDTVSEGGKYDGAVGTLAALEIIRDLNDRNIKTRHPIDIFSFACEESSRFGFSMIGSKLLTGQVKSEEIAHLSDKSGCSIQQAFASCGLDFGKAEDARLRPGSLAAFMEMHIEQGPVLEAQDCSIGIVAGIAAPTRFTISVTGHAAHSGSTPMDHRQDALVGAAKIAIELEQMARSERACGTVATVGDIAIEPGVMNVVPGETTLKVDIRSISKSSKQRVVDILYRALDQLEKERHLKIECTMLCDDVPVRMDERVMSSFESACGRRRTSCMRMASGAGHDTMNLASYCPSGMIFIPSRQGISHHPDEYTSMEHIERGMNVLEDAVLLWAGVADGQHGRERGLHEQSAS
ncbi:MAG: Zn-dependent hydrolase [Sporolactobacillus sp.]